MVHRWQTLWSLSPIVHCIEVAITVSRAHTKASMCPSQQELRDDFNQKGFEFLMVDLDTAIAFTQRARQSGDPAVKRRNADHARKAYNTVTRLRKKFELDSEQQNAFEQQLMKLKTALDQCGEQFNAGRRNVFRQSDVLLDRTKELLIESEPGRPSKRRP